MVMFSPKEHILYYVGWRSFHHRGYFVAIDRTADVIAVKKYFTDSITDTEENFLEATWETTDWIWKGKSESFYELCKRHGDLQIADRRIDDKDIDAKWIFKLQDIFVQWIDSNRSFWENRLPKIAFNAIRGSMTPATSYEQDMQTFDDGERYLEDWKQESDRIVNEWNDRMACSGPDKIRIVPASESNLPDWIKDSLTDMETQH